MGITSKASGALNQLVRSHHHLDEHIGSIRKTVG